MDKFNINEQYRLLEREIALTGESVDALRRDHRAEMDELRLEIEVLRRCLTLAYPDFTERYNAMREQVVQEVDPEKS